LRQKLIDEAGKFKIEVRKHLSIIFDQKLFSNNDFHLQISDLQAQCDEKCQKVKNTEEAVESKQVEIERLESMVKEYRADIIDFER